VPQNVFVTAPVANVAQTTGADPALLPQVFAEAIQSAEASYAPAMAKVEDFYARMHNCCVRLPEEGSQWERGACAAGIVWKSAQQCTMRKISQRDDIAVRAMGAGISKTDSMSCAGKFLDFCPVTFQENNSLAKCQPGLDFAVEYRGQIYKMRNEDCMQKFLAGPGAYLNGISLLAAPGRGRVPVPVPAGELVAADMALEGHCPVTLWLDTRDRRCVIPGATDCQVQYGDLIYRMASKEAVQAFMEKPWVYSDLVLPAKMPASRSTVPLDALPARGYCEQTLARSVTAALNALCEQRPKYPGLSVEDSVLKFLSLHLRSNNKRENEEQHELSQNLFDEYVDGCNLAPFLSTQPIEAENYREKQEKFETCRNRPWEVFMKEQLNK